MIRGRLDALWRAWVPVEIRDNNGQFQTIEVVVDTGFNGYLALPTAMISRLGLEPGIPINVTLGTGTREQVNTRIGQVLLHENLYPVSVLESEGNPLLGMQLLVGSQLNIQVRPGGEVVIEEM